MRDDHTNDVSAVSIPDDAPGTHGEVFDYVLRKGPISHREICNNTPFMSPDEIHDALSWFVDRNHIERVKGDLEEHGTTRRVYYVPEPDE